MIHFVLGGARSGKSRFAEQQVKAFSSTSNKKTTYIATATAIDDEMNSRILKHQDDRGDEWQLIECPLLLTNLIKSLNKDNVYLIDCLTLWLNNQLFSVNASELSHQTAHLDVEIDKLIDSLKAVDVDIIIVSNEIGLGVVPMGESTRLYVDYCGWLNQKVAAIADKVTLVTAGIPMCIKNFENDES